MHQLAFDLKDHPLDTWPTCKIVEAYTVSQHRLSVIEVRNLRFEADNKMDVPQSFQKKKDSEGGDDFLDAAAKLLRSTKSTLQSFSQKEAIPFDPAAAAAAAAETRKRNKAKRTQNENKEPGLQDIKRARRAGRGATSAAGSASASASTAGAAAVADVPAVEDVENDDAQEDDDEMQLDLEDVRKEWLAALDAQDPCQDLGAADADPNLIQGTDGRVTYIPPAASSSAASSSTARPTRKDVLGSIVYLNAGTPKATLKVHCFQHSKCVIFRKVSKLPAGSDLQARRWLLHGYQKYRFRNQAEKHMTDVVDFLGKLLGLIVFPAFQYSIMKHDSQNSFEFKGFFVNR